MKIQQSRDGKVIYEDEVDEKLREELACFTWSLSWDKWNGLFPYDISWKAQTEQRKTEWLERIKPLMSLFQSAQAEAVRQLKDKVAVLFWFDDDAETAGTLVTGSVIYSELKDFRQALSNEGQ